MKPYFLKFGFLLSLTLVSHLPLFSAADGGAGGGPAVPVAIVNDETSINSLTKFADIAFKNKQEFNAPNVVDQRAASLNPPLLSHEIVKRALDAYLERAQAEIQNEETWNTQPTDATLLNNLTMSLEKTWNFHRGEYTFDNNTTDILPFAQQKNIENNEKVICLGDLHGSMHSLLRNLFHMAQQEFIDNNFKLAPGVKLVMLGDMTDRGCYGTEVIYLLLKLKLENWDNVFLLRGNHENAQITGSYGFSRELTAKYAAQQSTLYELFLKFCRTLPLALFMKNSDVVVQCCHGGIEPYYAPNDFLDTEKKYDTISQNVEELTPPTFIGECTYAIGEGFQWSDFTGFDATWQKNTRGTWHFNTDKHLAYNTLNKSWIILGARYGGRGQGFNTNAKDLKKYFIDRPKIVKIIRGHQDRQFCCKLLNDGEKNPVEWCSIPPYIQTYGKTAPSEPAVEGFSFELNDETRRQNRVCAATKGLNFSQMPDVVTWTSAVEGQGCTSEGYGTVTFVPGGYENWTCTIYQNPTHNPTVRPESAYGYVIAKPINYDEYDTTPSHEWTPDSDKAGVSVELKNIVESVSFSDAVAEDRDAYRRATGGGSATAAPGPVRADQAVVSEYDNEKIHQAWVEIGERLASFPADINEAVEYLRTFGRRSDQFLRDAAPASLTGAASATATQPTTLAQELKNALDARNIEQMHACLVVKIINTSLYSTSPDMGPREQLAREIIDGPDIFEGLSLESYLEKKYSPSTRTLTTNEKNIIRAIQKYEQRCLTADQMEYCIKTHNLQRLIQTIRKLPAVGSDRDINTLSNAQKAEAMKRWLNIHNETNPYQYLSAILRSDQTRGINRNPPLTLFAFLRELNRYIPQAPTTETPPMAEAVAAVVAVGDPAAAMMPREDRFNVPEITRLWNMLKAGQPILSIRDAYKKLIDLGLEDRDLLK